MKFLTIKEAVKYTGICETVIRSAIKAGQIEAKNMHRDHLTNKTRRGQPLGVITVAIEQLDIFMSKRSAG